MRNETWPMVLCLKGKCRHKELKANRNSFSLYNADLTCEHYTRKFDTELQVLNLVPECVVFIGVTFLDSRSTFLMPSDLHLLKSVTCAAAKLSYINLS